MSCGYNLKTDKEIAKDSYKIEQAKEEVKEVKEQLKQFKDSLAILAIKEERFKDSLEFTNLSRIMCYNKGDHRHSCEIYGEQLMTTTNEANIGQPIEAINEQTVVASN